MSLITAGTTAQTSLNGFIKGSGATGDAASFTNAIKNDLVNGHPIWPGAFMRNGLLYIPNRGVLAVLKGDLIAYDSQGWPILVSANSVANAAWIHS